MKNKEYNQNLFKAILSLETIDECQRFFDDLCTITEIQAMSQRIEVAQMLNNTSVYSEVIAKTGASSATVSRVARCLNYGADGYKLVLKRLEGKRNE